MASSCCRRPTLRDDGELDAPLHPEHHHGRCSLMCDRPLDQTEVRLLPSPEDREWEAPMNVLWPQHYWGADRAAELEGLGPGLSADFVARFAEVTDDQWRTCEAIVGPSPPPAILEKLGRCRI